MAIIRQLRLVAAAAGAQAGAAMARSPSLAPLCRVSRRPRPPMPLPLSWAGATGVLYTARAYGTEDSSFSRLKGLTVRTTIRSSSGKSAIQNADPEWQPDPMYTGIKPFLVKSPGDIHNGHIGQQIRVGGRIQSVRRAGSKLLFVDIVGCSDKLQVMVNFAKVKDQGLMPDFGTYRTLGETADEGEGGQASAVTELDLDGFRELAKELQRGMFIEAVGTFKRTDRGGLAVDATHFPRRRDNGSKVLPETLADEETRIQQRHVDLLVNRQAVDVLRARSIIIGSVRRKLMACDFVEVQTPLLAEHAGGAAARPFATYSTEFPGRELALRVAPELWLKRLVVGGFDRVFELGPCFRNEGVDQTHNPEFTMLETYTAWANLQDLTQFTMRLIRGCIDGLQLEKTRKRRQHMMLPMVNWARFKSHSPTIWFVPTLEKALGFTLPDLEAPTALADLTDLMRKHGVDAGDITGLSLPRLLDRLQSRFLEPMTLKTPHFISGHPACMSPLAKSFKCSKTGQMLSLRAEYFVDGLELANMYQEENEADAQEAKFRAQARLRRVVVPREEDEEAEKAKADTGDDASRSESELEPLSPGEASYVEALRSGMPPTGGLGIGIDRLVMALTGTARIRDVLPFGTLKNVVGLSRQTVASVASSSSSSSLPSSSATPPSDDVSVQEEADVVGKETGQPTAKENYA